MGRVGYTFQMVHRNPLGCRNCDPFYSGLIGGLLAWQAARRVSDLAPLVLDLCFVHNRVFSNYFVLALIIDTLLRTFAPGFWR